MKNLFNPVITSDDLYFKGLHVANAGMLHEGNLFLMEHAIQNLPAEGAVIEIGSFCGQSTNSISYLLRKYELNRAFFSCDPWDFEEGTQSNFIYKLGLSYESYCAFIKESFIRNVSFFSAENLPYSIQSSSDDFFRRWNDGEEMNDVFGRTIKSGGTISFAFVDGDHRYEFVKRDFQNIHRHLVKGGFILFDDSADHYSFGSALLMKEIRTDKNYELVKKNPNYLFKRL